MCADDVPPLARPDLLSRRVQAIPASGIRRFFELIANMEGVISLGVGEPDCVTPRRFTDAAVRALADGQTHDTSNYGIPELRQAVSDHLDRLYGVRYDPASEILITTGVSEGLLLATHATLDSGDEVLCPDPYYVAYLPCVALAGGVFVPVPTDPENDFRVRAEDVEAHVTPRTKAILIGYPANPTGASMTRDDLLALADVAARHNLVVISDEIYDRLTYGLPHTCFASLPGMRERTILLGGFSKAYAMTGWRVGWACAPASAGGGPASGGDILEAMMKVHQYIIMSAPTPSQYAALEALRNGEDEVQTMVAEYDRRRRLIVDGFNRLGLTCFEPRGAFYAFPSVRSTGLSDHDFAERLLLEEKVAVVPGSAFGQCGVGHVRACYAAPYEQIEEALERIGRFVGRHRS
ncbi:MAG: aminotransferase class I/II-fold pyridoxal phosphate-dependent enzyme [Chloroflexota bacterium]|nr:aminotransferase class I/II-fold pyridoxal phosphate-dependent enzyme [Chloroflexota bacterium]